MWADAGQAIINLMTQKVTTDKKAHPGKASTRHPGHALRALRKIIAKEHISSLAPPKLAADIGGLNWL